MTKLLIIDNYDSFTYNLVAYCQELGAEVIIKYNDAVSINNIKQINPDKILLSPGPGSPQDSGICLELIDHFYKTISILGVCLGHQCIGQYFGGEVSHAIEPMHGKTSVIKTIDHQLYNNLLFNNIKNSITVTRYHSLVIKNNQRFPKELIITAVTDEQEIMAIQHKSYPVYGVQFHPEAVLSEYGHEILSNFLTACI